jgi:hypothetical protein
MSANLCHSQRQLLMTEAPSLRNTEIVFNINATCLHFYVVSARLQVQDFRFQKIRALTDGAE